MAPNARPICRAHLDSGGFYVIDRVVTASWAFFQEIVDAGASFVGRVQDNTVIHADEERVLDGGSPAAAGVVRDNRRDQANG